MGVPTEFTAGDRKTWTETAFSSSEIMTYAFQGWEGDVFLVTGSNDGLKHTFTLDQGKSSEFAPGRYTVAKVVEDGAGDRTTTRNVATTVVYLNPAVAPEETPNAKTLKALKSLMDERVKYGLQESRSVGGLRVDKMGVAEHQLMIEKYERRVAREKDARIKALGRDTHNEIMVQF